MADFLEPAESDILDQLRSISRGVAKLPSERALSERLGVNRYVLRRALSLMRQSGELETPSRVKAKPASKFGLRGAQIVEHTSPVELWEMRLSVEPQIAKAAALRGTPKELQAISDCHARADAKIFDLELDIGFHSLIAVASHNKLWIIMLDLLNEITRDDSFKRQLPPYTSVTGYEHHDEILRCIMARDGVGAEAIMHRHITAIRRWVMGEPPLPEK